MIKIRPATAGDSRDVFDWRNDEQTRRASISQSEVGWAEHERWLASSLADSSSVLFIAELVDEGDAASAVGMCRFDLAADRQTAEVSINLNPAFRGRGLSGPVLRAAIKRFLAAYEGATLEATIRLDNVASGRIFTASGFSRRSADAVFGYYFRK
jgi:RimJ/RimL family protein N-acetyltransferase